MAERVAIVGAVGEQASAGAALSDEVGCGDDVGCLTGGQMEDMRPAVLVGENMDLGRSAAARSAYRLEALPPFWAPEAERCALTEELSIIAVSGGSALSTRAAKIACHSPRLLQRL